MLLRSRSGFAYHGGRSPGGEGNVMYASLRRRAGGWPLVCLAVVLTAATAPCATAQQRAATNADASVSPQPLDAAHMTAAAIALLASLGPGQVDAASFPLAGEARTNWSNVPPYVHERPGLRVGSLTERQKLLVHDLLRASLSSQGYQKVAGVMRLDDIHRARTLASQPTDISDYDRAVNESFGSANYFVAFFGDPRVDREWAWLLQGHHLGASFTVAGEDIGFLPLFLGAGPLEADRGDYLGWSALSYELDYAADLVRSLTADQLARATSAAAVPGDVINGVGHKGAFTPREGLSAAELAPPQKALLRRLVEEYVRNASPSAAAAQLAAIGAAGWDNLTLSWRGTPGDRSGDFYYRIQGDRILIECTHQPQHMHSIVRDPANDYGEQWLGLDYREETSAADRFAAAAARRGD